MLKASTETSQKYTSFFSQCWFLLKTQQNLLFFWYCSPKHANFLHFILNWISYPLYSTFCVIFTGVKIIITYNIRSNCKFELDHTKHYHNKLMQKYDVNIHQSHNKTNWKESILTIARRIFTNVPLNSQNTLWNCTTFKNR